MKNIFRTIARFLSPVMLAPGRFSASLALLLCAANSSAADQCRQLTTSPFIGIKQSRQYLRHNQLQFFKNTAAAGDRGYERFRKCSAKPALRVAGIICKKIIGVKADLRFLKAADLILLRSVKEARRRGFEAYRSCVPTPTPTPTPQSTAMPSVTPLAGLKFNLEAGVRLPGVNANTIVPVENGGYRAFLGYTASSFNVKVLKTSTSADGLNWAEPVVLGMTKPSHVSYADPSVVRRGSSFLLVFRQAEPIGAAGIDVNSFYRSVSSDGINFSIDPSQPIFNRSEIGWYHPNIVSIGEHALRLYYQASGRRSAVSNDDGLTWTEEEGEVVILGSSENFASYPTGMNVIALPDGRFRMFCYSRLSETNYFTAIYSALSSDGRVFQLEQGPLLTPPAEKYYVNPHAVLLPDGKYRLYVTEQGDQLEYNLLSAVSE